MSVDSLDTRAERLPVQAGVDKESRQRLAELLSECLASSYVLYAKIHAYHWNVAGPAFYSVHKLTDEQYNDLADAIDKIAERTRAIGFPALVGLKQYLEHSVVSDAVGTPSTREMVEDLARDHHSVAGQFREAVAVAEDANDVYTADLLTSRIGFHEEAAWMLNATAVE